MRSSTLLTLLKDTPRRRLPLSQQKEYKAIKNMVIRDTPPSAPPAGLRIDRKRFRQLMEKKIALGHKPGDHEEQGYIGPATVIWPDGTKRTRNIYAATKDECEKLLA